MSYVTPGLQGLKDNKIVKDLSFALRLILAVIEEEMQSTSLLQE